MNVFVMNVADWGVKGLVAAPFSIIDILPDDFPIFEFEDLFSKNIVRLKEPIEDESGNILESKIRRSMGTLYLCVVPSRSVLKRMLARLEGISCQNTDHYKHGWIPR